MGDNVVNLFNGTTRQKPQTQRSLGITLPFTDDTSTSAIIHESIPVYNADDDKKIDALVLYELSPKGWHIVYCHTAMQNGACAMDDLDGSALEYTDYRDIPQAQVMDAFDHYRDLMIEACDQKLWDNKTMHPDDVEEIYEMILDLQDATPDDFTLDIYIPQKLCKETGELYIRPSELNGSHVFNNPMRDITVDAPQGFLRYFHHVVTKEVPAHGFELTCDQQLQQSFFEDKLQELKDKYDYKRYIPSPVHGSKQSKTPKLRA